MRQLTTIDGIGDLSLSDVTFVGEIQEGQKRMGENTSLLYYEFSIHLMSGTVITVRREYYLYKTPSKPATLKEILELRKKVINFVNA